VSEYVTRALSMLKVGTLGGQRGKGMKKTVEMDTTIVEGQAATAN